MSTPPRTMPFALLRDGAAPEPRANRLLAALAADDAQAWSALLRPMQLQRGQVLRADRAYFPTTATVTLFATNSGGDSTEVATVGNEGFVGVALLGGCAPMREQAEVTGSGHAWAIEGSSLRSEFQRSAATMDLLLRYLQLQMAQATQRALCVRHHSACQRLCRCLLDTLDRGRWRCTIELTHQSMATRLGVRRETITGCAQQLQSQGILTYHRGIITVHDFTALCAASCPCYDEMRRAHDRLLPPPDAAVAGDIAPRVPGLAEACLAMVVQRRHRTDPLGRHGRPEEAPTPRIAAARARAAGVTLVG